MNKEKVEKAIASEVRKILNIVNKYDRIGKKVKVNRSSILNMFASNKVWYYL